MPTHGVVPRLMSSVRFRLTLTVTLVVAVAIAGGGFLLIRSVEATLLGETRQRASVVVESMVMSIEQGELPIQFMSTADPSLADLLGRTGAAGRDDIDQTLSSTIFYLDGDIPEELINRVGMSGGRVTLFGRDVEMDRLGRVIDTSRPLTLAGRNVTLHAVTPLAQVDRTVRTLQATLWIMFPMLLAVAGALVWYLTGSALRPVGAITRRVAAISGSSLSGRVPVPEWQDEIHDLAVTMNAMLARIEHSAELQRQFVSDASHELRSPVASIRAQVETALMHAEDTDWPRVARTVLREDERLEHLIGNLLAMARLDEGRWGPRHELYLEEIVLDQARRQSPHSPITVDVSGVLAGRVIGNESELTSVVRNLVDNAVRHAQSRVTVSLTEAESTVTLIVADDGPGIPVEDRERIFERFARLQEGRSRDAGGSGLGLALCHRIVHAHRGRIGVADLDGHSGAAFIVQLPAVGE